MGYTWNTPHVPFRYPPPRFWGIIPSPYVIASGLVTPRDFFFMNFLGFRCLTSTLPLFLSLPKSHPFFFPLIYGLVFHRFLFTMGVKPWSLFLFTFLSSFPFLVSPPPHLKPVSLHANSFFVTPFFSEMRIFLTFSIIQPSFSWPPFAPSLSFTHLSPRSSFFCQPQPSSKSHYFFFLKSKVAALHVSLPSANADQGSLPPFHQLQRGFHPCVDNRTSLCWLVLLPPPNFFDLISFSFLVLVVCSNPQNSRKLPTQRTSH